VLDRKPMFFRSKIRNPKHEIRDVLKASAANNDRNKNAPMTKTWNFQCISFGHFVIRYSNLFRICGLRLENSTDLRLTPWEQYDIRILPEYDFSFRH